MKKILSLLILVFLASSVGWATDYKLITSTDDLVAGKKYIIASAASGSAYAMAEQTSNNRTTEAAIITSGVITVADGSAIAILTLGGNATDGWSFFDGTGYLYAASSSSKSYLRTQTTNDTKGLFSITIDSSGDCVPTAKSPSTRNILEYNNTQHIFNCYAASSNMKPVYLYKEVEGAVATPTFSVSGGEYTEAQSVELDCATAGAEIHYTTDGTDPVATSALYSTAIAVNETMTIKAIATLNGESSNIASATYTITLPTEVANIAAFNALSDGTVVKFTNPVTVGYQNGTKLYVQDETGGMYIKGTVGKTYKTGDVIPAGFAGEYATDTTTKPCLDITNTASTFGDATEGTLVPAVITVADAADNLFSYVRIENATISTTSSSLSSSSPFNINETLVGFNSFGITMPSSTAVKYNINGIIIWYKTYAELVPTSFEEAITPVESNLDAVINNGTVGDTYKLNMELTGVYADTANGILYAKTDNGACSNISTNENPGRDYYADNADDFDQSDWIALKVSNPTGYEGVKLASGITGVWNGSELEVASATSGAAIEYTPNLYEPRNFCEVLNENGLPIFYVAPKANEYAECRGHIVSDGNGGYNLSTQVTGQAELLVPFDNTLGVITAESTDHYARVACVVKKSGNDVTLYAVKTPTITTGVEANMADGNVAVYGTNGAVNVKGVEAAMAVSVYDAMGREVKATTIDADATIALPAGFYIVRAGDNATRVVVK